MDDAEFQSVLFKNQFFGQNLLNGSGIAVAVNRFELSGFFKPAVSLFRFKITGMNNQVCRLNFVS